MSIALFSIGIMIGKISINSKLNPGDLIFTNIRVDSSGKYDSICDVYMIDENLRYISFNRGKTLVRTGIGYSAGGRILVIPYVEQQIKK